MKDIKQLIDELPEERGAHVSARAEQLTELENGLAALRGVIKSQEDILGYWYSLLFVPPPSLQASDQALDTMAEIITKDERRLDGLKYVLNAIENGDLIPN